MLSLVKAKESIIVEEDTIQEAEAEEKHHKLFKHLIEENQSQLARFVER